MEEKNRILITFLTPPLLFPFPNSQQKSSVYNSHSRYDPLYTLCSFCSNKHYPDEDGRGNSVVRSDGHSLPSWLHMKRVRGSEEPMRDKEPHQPMGQVCQSPYFIFALFALLTSLLIKCLHSHPLYAFTTSLSSSA